MSKKTKDVIIDADHILFYVTEANKYNSKLGEDSVALNDEKIDLKPYKKHFKSIVDEYVKIAETESIFYGWKLGEVKVILSDKTNFRYEIFPEYKNKRPSSPPLRKKLKKWAMKKYIVEPNTEADDVVAYYVRKGGLGFTTDKDLLLGVEGRWFNCHHKHLTWSTTEAHDADKFFKMQVLAGDGVDGIPSIKGVGLPTAKKLMDSVSGGWFWHSILEIFKSKGYDINYMVTMARLVSMSQWSPKKGVELWRIPK